MKQEGDFLRVQVLRYCERKYGSAPDYPWRSSPYDFVLRHAEDRKWYALVMRVARGRLALAGEGETDILNLKTDERIAGSLLLSDGFLPAYHMQKGSWITVLLDGTVPFTEITPLIDLSFALTGGKTPRSGPKNWLVPANPRYYDVDAAIRESGDGVFIWKQSSRVSVGDTVYLYLAAPVSAICYRCAVVRADIPFSFADENVRMSRVMQLRLLHRYADGEFPFARLRDHGVFAVRGPRGVPDTLLGELEKAAT